MFGRGVPEKMIAQKSGHKSLKAIRAYERTSSTQEKAAGECIQSARAFEEACGVYSQEDEPSVALPMVPSQKTPGAPEGFQKLMQQFSEIHNCTFNFYSSLLGLA